MDEKSKTTGDRRPIRARSSAWARRVTDALVAAKVSPNAISIFGMIAALGAGAALAGTSFVDPPWHRGLFVIGAGLIGLRLAANMFDGMVAIGRGVGSRVGELYNEAPDRISDAAVLIGAGYAMGSNVAMGYVAACVSIFVAYVRALAQTAGAPSDFCGPMAKPHRMAVVMIACVYLAAMPEGAYGDAMTIALIVVIVGGIFTAIRRLKHAASFLRSSKTEDPT